MLERKVSGRRGISNEVVAHVVSHICYYFVSITKIYQILLELTENYLKIEIKFSFGKLYLADGTSEKILFVLGNQNCSGNTAASV